MDHDQRVDLHQWQSPARAVPALHLWVAVERVVCVSHLGGTDLGGEVSGVGVPGEVKEGPWCE